MSEKFSKEYEMSSGKKVVYTFDDSGRLVGIQQRNTNNVFEPVRRSDPDFDAAISGDNLVHVNRAYNIVKNGSNKEGYTKEDAETPFEKASDEEIDSFYTKAHKSFINAGFVDNTFDKPKPLAYAIRKEPRKGSDIMAYPLDISEDQDHFKITRYKYVRPNINQSKPASKETNVAGDSVKGSQLKGSILLPMPKATDVNGVEWGKSELTISGLAAVSIAQGTGNAAGAAVDFATSNLGGKLNRRFTEGQVQGDTMFNTEEQRRLNLAAKRSGNRRKGPNFGDVKAFGQAQTLQAIAAAAGLVTGTTLDADTVLGRTGGRVLNPNAEMLFQGPVIRDFAFSFVMIARSQKEGDEIRKIVRFLKLGMAPKFQNTTFLSAPDIFQLEYRNKDGELKTVNRFNPGGLALTTMNVDYAPNGYWSAYTDSQPVAMKMDLNFTELRPLFEGDQENTPEDSVGL